MTVELLVTFIQAHWQVISALGALAYISFVNAIPERRQDWDTYSVIYHFLRGLTPVSKQSPPPK